MTVQASSDDLESCTVCLERYQISGENEPKLLECLHTFCYGCLNKMQTNNKIKCPNCRHETRGKVEGLPKNTLATRKLDVNRNVQNETTEYVFEVLKKSLGDAEKVRTALEILDSDVQLSNNFMMAHLAMALTCFCQYSSDSCRDYAVVKTASSFIYHQLLVAGETQISASVLVQIAHEVMHILPLFPFGDELKENCLSILKDTRIFVEQPFYLVEATKIFIQSLHNITSQPLKERILRFLLDARSKMSLIEVKAASTPDLLKALLRFVSGDREEKNSPSVTIAACNLICNMVFKHSQLNDAIVTTESLRRITNIFMDNEFPSTAKHSLMVALTNCSDRNSTRLQMLKEVPFVRSLQHIVKTNTANSYSYAYAIAMLLLEPEDKWTCSSLRNELATDLYAAILSWNSSVKTGIIFHDVKFCFPLLQRHDIPAVQLFITWTLKRLCECEESFRAMLLSCDGIRRLNNVKNNTEVPEDAKAMIECVLRSLN